MANFCRPYTTPVRGGLPPAPSFCCSREPWLLGTEFWDDLEGKTRPYVLRLNPERSMPQRIGFPVDPSHRCPRLIGEMSHQQLHWCSRSGLSLQEFIVVIVWDSKLWAKKDILLFSCDAHTETHRGFLDCSRSFKTIPKDSISFFFSGIFLFFFCCLEIYPFFERFVICLIVFECFGTHTHNGWDSNGRFQLFFFSESLRMTQNDFVKKSMPWPGAAMDMLAF